jgi:hypothetical protein
MVMSLPVPLIKVASPLNLTYMQNLTTLMVTCLTWTTQMQWLACPNLPPPQPAHPQPLMIYIIAIIIHRVAEVFYALNNMN